MTEPRYFALANSNTQKYWYFEIQNINQKEFDYLTDDWDEPDGFMICLTDNEGENGVLDLNGSEKTILYVSYEIDDSKFPSLMDNFREWFVRNEYIIGPTTLVDQQTARVLGIE